MTAERLRIATEAIHDATPVEADGGVPDVCNRYEEHEELAKAVLAALDRMPTEPADEPVSRALPDRFDLLVRRLIDEYDADNSRPPSFVTIGLLREALGE